MNRTPAEVRDIVEYWRKALETHQNYLWAWSDFTDRVRDTELLHFDECYPECGCDWMRIHDWINLLPYHCDSQFPPLGYRWQPHNICNYVQFQSLHDNISRFIGPCILPLSISNIMSALTLGYIQHDGPINITSQQLYTNFRTRPRSSSYKGLQ